MAKGNFSATEWGLCDQCMHDGDLDACMGCTYVAGMGATAEICGIPCGTSLYYGHQNFEKRDEVKSNAKARCSV